MMALVPRGVPGGWAEISTLTLGLVTRLCCHACVVDSLNNLVFPLIHGCIHAPSILYNRPSCRGTRYEGAIRTAEGNAPEPQFPLRIHYACTIPTAQSALDANLGSNGPELYHGKVSIRRSYSSSYICSSVVYGPPHVILCLGPPCTHQSPFSFLFTF